MRPTDILASLGRSFFSFSGRLARITRFTGIVIKVIFIEPWQGRPIRWGATFVQMVTVGVNSLPIVGTISFIMGLIIAMQSAYQLQRFGAVIYVADLVGVSVTRELAPLITAIIIAGRSGSAIAAEIGSMKVSEELDALRTMALNPFNFLVAPRTLAMMIVLPCLTVLADLLGILGGMILGITSLNIPWIAYFNETANAVMMSDFVSGLVKSFFFAAIIAIVGAFQGFHVVGGAEGVGKATTSAVVQSIFLIILADMLFTALFYSTF
jgi:phospholipid/cholesterol/gamma-HCH transport system permease protein